MRGRRTPHNQFNCSLTITVPTAGKETQHAMFNRLIESFGRPANQHDGTTVRDGELQLAAAVLLFGVLPIDYVVTSDEGAALRKSLQTLFGFSPDKCHRMIARAAAVHGRDPSILAATTLLKRRTSEEFRLRLMTEWCMRMKWNCRAG